MSLECNPGDGWVGSAQVGTLCYYSHRKAHEGAPRNTSWGAWSGFSVPEWGEHCPAALWCISHSWRIKYIPLQPKSKPTQAYLSPPPSLPCPSTVGGISHLSTCTQKPEVHHCPECLVTLHACKGCKMKMTDGLLNFHPKPGLQCQTVCESTQCLPQNNLLLSNTLYPFFSKRKHCFWDKAKQKWLLLGSLVEQMTKTVKWELPFALLPPPRQPYWNEFSCMNTDSGLRPEAKWRIIPKDPTGTDPEILFKGTHQNWLDTSAVWPVWGLEVYNKHLLKLFIHFKL